MDVPSVPSGAERDESGRERLDMAGPRPLPSDEMAAGARGYDFCFLPGIFLGGSIESESTLLEEEAYANGTGSAGGNGKSLSLNGIKKTPESKCSE